MLRRYIQIASLMAVLFGLSACQFFIDGRDESLLVVTAEEWAEMHRYKEEKRMAKIDANRPQAMPGSEAISFANLSDAYLA